MVDYDTKATVYTSIDVDYDTKATVWWGYSYDTKASVLVIPQHSYDTKATVTSLNRLSADYDTKAVVDARIRIDTDYDTAAYVDDGSQIFPVWPITLPDPLLRGNSFLIGDTTISTEYAYSSERRIFKSGLNTVKLNFSFTSDELAIFKTFYETDLYYGAMSFTANWDGVKTFKFLGAYSSVRISECRYSLSATFQRIGV